jgi:hypothetical protein
MSRLDIRQRARQREPSLAAGAARGLLVTGCGLRVVSEAWFGGVRGVESGSARRRPALISVAGHGTSLCVRRSDEYKCLVLAQDSW